MEAVKIRCSMGFYHVRKEERSNMVHYRGRLPPLKRVSSPGYLYVASDLILSAFATCCPTCARVACPKRHTPPCNWERATCGYKKCWHANLLLSRCLRFAFHVPRFAFHSTKGATVFAVQVVQAVGDVGAVGECGLRASLSAIWAGLPKASLT